MGGAVLVAQLFIVRGLFGDSGVFKPWHRYPRYARAGFVSVASLDATSKKEQTRAGRPKLSRVLADATAFPLSILEFIFLLAQETS